MSDGSGGALATVARLLACAGARYVVIGPHGVNAWIEPRFTADIDVSVEAAAPDLARLRAVLGEHGFAVERESGAELPSGPDFLMRARACGPSTPAASSAASRATQAPCCRG